MLTAVREIGKNLKEHSESNDRINTLIYSTKAKITLDEKKVNHYRLGVIFNIIEKKLEFKLEGIYDKDVDNKHYLYIGTYGGNYKNLYASFPYRSINKLIEKNLPAIKLSIENKDKNYKNNKLWQEINSYVDIFYEKDKDEFRLKDEILKNTFGEIKDINYSKEIIKITGINNSNEEIVLAYSMIDEETSFVKEYYPEFKALLLKSILEKDSKGKIGYCTICKDEKELLSKVIFGRANINQIFVTKTIHSANNIDEKNYYKNYQICQECYENLVESADFIKDNFNLNIAGIRSYIIPQFFNNTKIDYKGWALKIYSITKKQFDGSEFQTSADLAFDSENIASFTRDLQDLKEDDFPLFILNFVSYDTDGTKYFKIVNHIKDVSKFHFIKVMETLEKEHKPFVNVVKKFNLGTLYRLIPEKSDTKKNRVLSLYSSILTNTRIDKGILYKYFTEYILCQRYQRKYDNIWLYSKESFDFAIRDGVFKYLILLNSIKNLEEQKMETTIEEKQDVEVLDFKELEDFIKNQKYTEAREEKAALCYLGDLLYKAGIAQFYAGHKTKPILNRVNFQGMDKKEIYKLFGEITDKLNQYNRKEYKAFNNAEFSIKNFTELYGRNYETWSLSNEANIFYILSGYSFNVSKKSGKTNDNNGEKDINNEQQDDNEE